MTQIEEHMAHLMRAVDDLSEVVACQEATIAMLNRRVQLLMECEAEREALATGQAQVTNDPPPHW